MTNKVRSEDFVLLLPRTESLSMFSNDCSIVLQDTALLSTMMAPILPKGSTLTRPLSDVYVSFVCSYQY